MRDSRTDILRFWFDETRPRQWFQTDPGFDDAIRERFLGTYEMARQGMCEFWASDSGGSLALVILLDQFPRNMFRGEAQAFETDSQALLIARHALALGYDQLEPPQRRRFLYMPFMHSERTADQALSVRLFESLRETDPQGYRHALRHREEIRRFGRFPYRNAALGRSTTPEERDYLASGYLSSAHRAEAGQEGALA